jgi:hypothetical protein
MLIIPHCLDNQLTDGDEVVSLHVTGRAFPPLPQKHFLVLISVLEARVILQLEGLGKLEGGSTTSSGIEPATFQLAA